MSDKDNPHAPALVNIRKGIKRRQKNVVIHLPQWPEHKRGVPNSFIRSALFAAIQGKDRRYMNREILASQNGIKVKFTGLQLNQTDLEVWAAITQTAREKPLGERSQISAHKVLKTLGLDTGSSQHEQLHSSIIRLTACAVEVEHDELVYAGPLIKSMVKEKVTRQYSIELNKELIKLFGEAQWTALDWEQRKLLRNKPLALSLHAFYSSHREPFPLKLETIHWYIGSHNTEMRDFKRQLKIALEGLVEIHFLLSYKIQGDIVHVEKTPKNLPDK